MNFFLSLTALAKCLIFFSSVAKASDGLPFTDKTYEAATRKENELVGKYVYYLKNFDASARIQSIKKLAGERLPDSLLQKPIVTILIRLSELNEQEKISEIINSVRKQYLYALLLYLAKSPINTRYSEKIEVDLGKILAAIFRKGFVATCISLIPEQGSLLNYYEGFRRNVAKKMVIALPLPEKSSEGVFFNAIVRLVIGNLRPAMADGMADRRSKSLESYLTSTTQEWILKGNHMRTLKHLCKHAPIDVMSNVLMDAMYGLNADQFKYSLEQFAESIKSHLPIFMLEIAYKRLCEVLSAAASFTQEEFITSFVDDYDKEEDAIEVIGAAFDDESGEAAKAAALLWRVRKLERALKCEMELFLASIFLNESSLRDQKYLHAYVTDYLGL